MRVPETSFDAAVRRFAALGHVESASTSSEDVTSQFVDLQARLQHYQSVERRLVRFLAQTGTISQMLAIQDRIDQTQLTIEQLNAELKSMREQTSYGTLTVSLTEKGSHHVVAAASTGFIGRFLHSAAVIGRGARVDRPVDRRRAPVLPAVRRDRSGRVVRRPAAAPRPPAAGAAVAAGLSGDSSHGRAAPRER